MKSKILYQVLLSFLFFCHLAISSALAQQISDSREATLREAYRTSSKDSDIANDFYEKLKSINEEDAKAVGYKGAFSVLMAKHAFFPTTKLSYFHEGTPLLDHAITIAPWDAELRFLRLSVQEHSPSFVDYDENITEDKALVFDFLKEITCQSDLNLVSFITDYLLKESPLSEQEKSAVRDAEQKRNGCL